MRGISLINKFRRVRGYQGDQNPNCIPYITVSGKAVKGHALPIVKIRCKNVSKAALMLMFHAEHLLPCGTTQIWQRKKEKKKSAWNRTW